MNDQPRPFIYESENRQMANPSALPGGTFQNPTPSTASGSFGLPGQSRLSWVNQLGIDVKECWVRENVIGDPPETDEMSDLSDAPNISDRWRVIVHAAGVVLLDELAEDLWEESRHPYDRFVFDDIGEFWGISLVTHLSNPQIAINRILAAVQQNAELTGNPILLEPSNSGVSRIPITNRPGERIQTNTGAANGMAKPEWMLPPTVPPYILDLLKFWISRMENTSGISGIAKGQSPPGRNAQSTVSHVQEAGFVRIRAGQHNLESTLRNLGNMLCQLIIQNYTASRTVAIVGPSGVKTALSLSAKHFYSPYRDASGQKNLPLKYSLIVTAGAKNPTSRSSRIAEADTLFALGAIDAQADLEAHNYPQWQDIVQRMNQQKLQLALAGELAKANKQGQGKRVKAQSA